MVASRAYRMQRMPTNAYAKSILHRSKHPCRDETTSEVLFVTCEDLLFTTPVQQSMVISPECHEVLVQVLNVLSASTQPGKRRHSGAPATSILSSYGSVYTMIDV